MPILPPRPKGPHLNAMRSFEAAARLGGFAAAAEELSVTPGAVSQQIKALEDWIGAPLFERRSQGVVLTSLGKSAQEDFVTAFDALGEALQGLRAAAPQTPVHIAALPSIAQLWLTPRLAKVRRAMPGQSISITAMETSPNLRREVFDISIFYDDAAGQEGAHVLERDVIFPVCTPQIAARLKTPDDLAAETLLHDATWAQDWQLWAEAAQVTAPDRPSGAVHSLYAIAVEEALGGAGVLMGHAALIAGHIAAGRLVQPFDIACETGTSLCLHMAGAPEVSSAAAQVVALLKQG